MSYFTLHDTTTGELLGVGPFPFDTVEPNRQCSAHHEEMPGDDEAWSPQLLKFVPADQAG